MPMATTREVGLCPAALTVDTQVSYSDLDFAPGQVWRKGCRCPGCQHSSMLFLLLGGALLQQGCLP